MPLWTLFITTQVTGTGTNIHPFISGWMFLPVPAHPDCPGQSPERCKMVVVVVVVLFMQLLFYLSWSSIIPYLLPPSFMIHGILLVQFTCLAVFLRNLSPSFLWSTFCPGTLHFILHAFLHPIIVFFLQHMPILLQSVLLVLLLYRDCHVILFSLSTLYL